MSVFLATAIGAAIGSAVGVVGINWWLLHQPIVGSTATMPTDLELHAWGLLANAWGGDWSKADPGWREAAEKWRDQHFNSLQRGA